MKRNILSFLPFFQKMLMSAFLLRFKAIYLEKIHGYPYFFLWIPGFKDLLSPCGPNVAQKPWYLVGTILNPDLMNKLIKME